MSEIWLNAKNEAFHNMSLVHCHQICHQGCPETKSVSETVLPHLPATSTCTAFTETNVTSGAPPVVLKLLQVQLVS